LGNSQGWPLWFRISVEPTAYAEARFAHEVGHFNIFAGGFMYYNLGTCADGILEADYVLYVIYYILNNISLLSIPKNICGFIYIIQYLSIITKYA